MNNLASYGKGFRTILLNFIILAVVILTALTGTLTDPDWLRGIAIATVVLNALMRFVTDTPVGKAS